MKLSDPDVNAALKDKLANQAGRHLYLILGSYEALDRYERVAYPELRTSEGTKLPKPISVSRSLLEKFQDEELQKLAGSELRQINHIKDRLYTEFDQLLVDGLEKSSALTLKQAELLFAFDIELDRVRIRAVNQKHILLMLPGEMSGDCRRSDSGQSRGDGASSSRERRHTSPAACLAGEFQAGKRRTVYRRASRCC